MQWQLVKTSWFFCSFGRVHTVCISAPTTGEHSFQLQQRRWTRWSISNCQETKQTPNNVQTTIHNHLSSLFWALKPSGISWIMRLAAIFWQLWYTYRPVNKPPGHIDASQVREHQHVLKVNPLIVRYAKASSGQHTFQDSQPVWLMFVPLPDFYLFFLFVCSVLSKVIIGRKGPEEGKSDDWSRWANKVLRWT